MSMHHVLKSDSLLETVQFAIAVLLVDAATKQAYPGTSECVNVLEGRTAHTCMCLCMRLAGRDVGSEGSGPVRGC